ncbi:hypothetical protein BJX63DRAFT_386751 [Aspergillus granulosus]|uniref:Uncharacterized protein n=1 Tax=Aspergillus granulosus TaxID=176169 RepID=A0ABR4HN81_9EURO
MASPPKLPAAPEHLSEPTTRAGYRPRRTNQISSRTYTLCSNAVAVSFVLSAFQSDLSDQTRLLRLLVAAVLTLTVHALILLFAPPEEQELSSFILCIISGAMSFYVFITMLW